MNIVDTTFTAEVWKRINGQSPDPSQPTVAPMPGLLKTIMGKIRVAQQIFPTTIRKDERPIPADTINLTTRVATGGRTKQFVTMTISFPLRERHVMDPDLTVAMGQISMAAQSLALAEDLLFFQGKDAIKGLTDAGVTVKDEDGIKDLGQGLLGLGAAQTISVQPSGLDRDGTPVYGSATFSAVTKGISQFGGVQGRPFALILDPATYADANIPLQDSSMIAPASAIKGLVEEGGFVMSPGLPPNTGLLVSLGGLTTTLYIGTEPVVKYDVAAASGDDYLFTVKESIQFHNIDARSLIKLDFKTPEEANKPRK